MSRYIRQVVYKGEFDGDQVEVVMRPLQFKDALAFQGRPPEEIGRTIAGLLRDYVVEVRGLFAADNTPVTKEEFLDSAYFTQVLISASLELVQRATVPNPQ